MLLSCSQCWMLFYPLLFQLAGVVRFTINRAGSCALEVNRHSQLRQPIWSEVCDTEASRKVLRWTWHLCVLGLDKHSWEAENAALGKISERNPEIVRRSANLYDHDFLPWIHLYYFTIQFVVRKYQGLFRRMKNVLQSFFVLNSKQASDIF